MARQTPENVVEFLRDRGYDLDTIPTLRELQSMVGGSLATISKAVAGYRAELSLAAQTPVPAAFKAIFDRAAESAWASVMSEAAKAADSAQRDAEGLLDQMRKECERLEGLNAELRAEIAAIKADLKDARDAVAEQTVRAKVADENAVHLVADIQRLREELAAAREAKAEAVGALKALKERGAWDGLPLI